MICSRHQSSSGIPIEKVYKGWVGGHVKDVTGLCRDPFAKCAHYRRRAHATMYLGFGAGGFDDLDDEGNAGTGLGGRCQLKVLGSDAIEGGMSCGGWASASG